MGARIRSTRSSNRCSMPTSFRTSPVPSGMGGREVRAGGRRCQGVIDRRQNEVKMDAHTIFVHGVWPSGRQTGRCVAVHLVHEHCAHLRGEHREGEHLLGRR
eukprot:scaffold111470_cov31-Tisochrysis_lutea.AAC.4